LVRIAETYDCAAIATNQVMASPDVFFGDPTRPIGGNVVAHTSTYRIYFKKSGKKRIARMVDSPHHPEEEVIFALGEAGIIDPEEAEKKSKKTAKKAITKKTKEPKVEATVEPKVEATVEPKVEATVEPKVEATVEPEVEILEDHGADITSDDL
jgi:DNA repair protein RadA